MTTKPCKHCGKPLECVNPVTGGIVQYHRQCAIIVKKKRGAETQRKHPEKNKASKKKWFESQPPCTCCGIYPRGRGQRFLCNFCYEWDGTGWMSEAYWLNTMRAKGIPVERVRR